MMFTRRIPQNRTVLALLIAAPALLLTMLVDYPAWNSAADAQTRIAGQRKELQKLQQLPVRPDSSLQPAAESGPAEAPQFLATITTMVGNSGCELMGMDTSNGPAGAKEGGEIRTARVKVTVAGMYPNVRRFLAELAGAPRIYTVNSVAISYAGFRQGVSGAAMRPEAADRRLRAVIGVERYLLMPASAAGADSGSAGASASSDPTASGPGAAPPTSS